MPICPGCEQKVPHDHLDIHERYCQGIWSEAEVDKRATERLERRLAALEDRVDGRLKTLESALERRSRGEERRRGRRSRRRE